MITCPKCNEPSILWSRRHGCCKDCAAVLDLDRFIPADGQYAKAFYKDNEGKTQIKELNFKSGKWECLSRSDSR